MNEKTNTLTKDEIITELNTKIYWFNNYYTIHEQKYRRLIALNIDVVENEQLLQDLYSQAEQVRVEIQSLEAKLKELSD